MASNVCEMLDIRPSRFASNICELRLRRCLLGYKGLSMFLERLPTFVSLPLQQEFPEVILQDLQSSLQTPMCSRFQAVFSASLETTGT